jgi:hypothetical protein
VNTNNAGAGSLRQAILDANANAGSDTIQFNIPGLGAKTIAPTSALPVITDPVVIDGTTQPGFSGAPIIELNGVSESFTGLEITAGSSTVKGLVINRFVRGIYLRTNGGNVVQGNYIGTDLAGSTARRNLVGISVLSSNNTIGGAAAGERNVISGNDTNISFDGAAATGNRVLGNYIGTNATGMARLQGTGGGRFGVTISSASSNFIGGAAAGEGNVISAHANEGVRIENGTGNIISGNFIGTGADGTLPLSNSLMGVRMLGSANNVVGGTASGAGNRIAYNFVGASVECNPQCSSGNAILGNSIFSNLSLGIDLAAVGNVLPNDAGDADTGANNLQNYPLLTSVSTSAGGTTIAGTLNSAPGTTFRIEFFANSVCDPSGHGEGSLFFGSTTATTDAGGNASFNASFPSALPAGQVITATATDPAGNTSEFSACSTGGPAGSIGFSTFNYSVFEDEGSATITVNRQGGSTGTLSVNYATSDGTATAGQDYTAIAGTLTFADGETTKTLIIPVINDSISEPTEDVSLTLSRAPGESADSVGPSNRAVLSIKDSGLLPALSVDCANVGEVCLPVSVTEGDSGVTNAVFTVRLSGDPRGKTVTVDYETVGVTATSGTDFQPTAGTLTFTPGVTTQNVTVPVIGDLLDEPNETFQLVLKNPSNAEVSTSGFGGEGLIIDNDPQPIVTINDVAVTEGNSGTTSATFTITLLTPSGLPVTVDYSTVDGTATSPGDYQAVGPNTSLTFQPGETSKSFTVTVNGDTLIEANETFIVNVYGPRNATTGQGTINNDDATTITLSASSYSVIEDGLRVNVAVNRSGDLSQASTVDYRTSDPSGLNNCDQVTGNASSRCDYATTAGTLRFAAGETSKTIIIPIVNDVYMDATEVFTVTLSNAAGGQLGAIPAATVTITNNDTAQAPNPIDNSEFFVQQLYIDFLGREPDNAGQAAWLGILNNCTVPTNCDRIAVAGGFVRSPEFTERGYFVYRAFRSSLGRFARYSEFIPDMARVSGFLSAEDLEANKVAYVEEFMSRQEFKDIYDATVNNPTAYVDTLLQKADLPNHPKRAEWIAKLSNNTLTRAQVLRELMESTELSTKYVNEAFIVMNYFGFLRRDPDAAYTTWINIFSTTNDDRLIINGFLNSLEYRFRFGPN